MPTNSTILETRPQTQTTPETSKKVTLAVRGVTIALIAAPIVGIIAAAILLLPPSPAAAIATIVGAFISVAGVTIGWHRMLTHRAFKAKPWLRDTLVWAGATSLEGAPISWAAMHREHHQYSDKNGDPHSPWRYKGEGGAITSVTKGFLHAQVGWLFDGFDAKEEKYVPDLLAEKRLKLINKLWWIAPITFSIILPFAIGFALGGWREAVCFLLWAGLVKIGLTHHFTWTVNSVCHIWGRKDFQSRDESRNVWWLAPFTAGESWHNTHHAFPSLAKQGVDRWQLDPSANLIWLFEKCGWASEVKWPETEKLEAKRIKPNSGPEASELTTASAQRTDTCI